MPPEMHTHVAAEVELWIARGLLLYGLVMGSWFLLTWWPRVPRKTRFSLAALDVGGWVAAFVLMYALVFANVVFWPTDNHDPDIVWTRAMLILFVTVINGAMTVRYLHWHRIRRGVDHHRDESLKEFQ